MLRSKYKMRALGGRFGHWLCSVYELVSDWQSVQPANEMNHRNVAGVRGKFAEITPYVRISSDVINWIHSNSFRSFDRYVTFLALRNNGNLLSQYKLGIYFYKLSYNVGKVKKIKKGISDENDPLKINIKE